MQTNPITRLLRLTVLFSGLFFGLFFGFAQQAQAEVIRVAAASNFIKPLKQIAALYQQQSEHSIKLSFASSGKIATQIMHGAPFDLFLSADSSQPHWLEQQGKGVKGSRFTYASGRLLLWTRQPQLTLDSPQALQPENFKHFAIANAKLAPYGRAAREALEHFPHQQALLAKRVTGENIAQTYRFVESGNAQFGLVALSQVYEQGAISKGSGWVVPASWHQPIQQQAILLKQAEQKPAVWAFYQFLKSDTAKQIIHSYGYEVE